MMTKRPRRVSYYECRTNRTTPPAGFCAGARDLTAGRDVFGEDDDPVGMIVVGYVYHTGGCVHGRSDLFPVLGHTRHLPNTVDSSKDGSFGQARVPQVFVLLDTIDYNHK